MHAIEVRGLHKRYGDKVAVDDLSLSVELGEIYGILGRNGAGKTTTVEAVAGLRRPDRGEVRVLGLDPRRDRARLRQVLGVQLQESALHSALTVRELMRLHRSFYRDGADPGELIDRMGLTEQRGTRFENLSGGQQQRLNIALALLGKPKAVILDELTTGLDPEARRQMWATVEGMRDQGVTVVLVSHHMEEVERLCDRVALIDAGRLAAVDTPAGLVTRAGLEQVVRFRTATPFDAAILDGVEEARSVRTAGDRVVVTGSGNLLHAVSTALVRSDVAALDTSFERATLEDAFLALTGSPFDGSSDHGSER
ncbi:ABC transporter ATP-binding protein [Glycomyces sp. TRM65418]|uniref:ABC transporter ATP-binding protein n=1 Tax=Glycomyces sp. TRM65418 TaxID=2867006 RepID=UPI001CE5160E|nr:ABC transporter ATP-binding protein [Glycomyces sp. TRM65418]MCC3765855.1 ABC transporter ATP-binding protein [Glycomyces sp. TRM65418]QZD55440.1 ABC transporter ATP-binding protein [Glycomyces sp. TRM65418]